MSKDKPDSLAIDGEGYRVAIIAARYNFQLVNALVESVLQTLTSSGVLPENVETFRVPGSNEIPHAAAMAAKCEDFDVVIGLGLIIEGDTDHHAIIGHATSTALQTVGINFEIPIINGIITVKNIAQAEARITGDLNRGAEFALAALEMARLNEVLETRIFENAMDLEMDDLDWPDEVLEDGNQPEDWPK